MRSSTSLENFSPHPGNADSAARDPDGNSLDAYCGTEAFRHPAAGEDETQARP